MCKETFLRLPEEKRTRFLDAAWEEFTRMPFSDVSINQIVQRAGIPRGSFYQYFEDKEDLFSYLLDMARTGFLETYRRELEAAGGNLFQTQIRCYDHFLSRDRGTDPLLDRCIQLLRVNPGMDIQKLMPEDPKPCPLEEVWNMIDLSVFRRQEKEFALLVFKLTLLTLGATIMDSFTCPERMKENRQRLIESLEIIQCGSCGLPN